MSSIRLTRRVRANATHVWTLAALENSCERIFPTSVLFLYNHVTLALNLVLVEPHRNIDHSAGSRRLIPSRRRTGSDESSDLALHKHQISAAVYSGLSEQLLMAPTSRFWHQDYSVSSDGTAYNFAIAQKMRHFLMVRSYFSDCFLQ